MRMLLTYLPLVAAILIGTTSTIILVTGNYFSREMDKMQKVTLYTVADVLDEKISSLYDVLYQLAMNSSVLDYIRIDNKNFEYKEIMTIQSVGAAVGNAVLNNPLIREAFLYRSDIDTVFSSQYRGKGLYVPSDNRWTFFSDYFEGMSRGDVCKTFTTITRRSFHILRNGDGTVLLLATPVPIASGDSRMVLALIVDSNELKRLSALSLGEKEELLITDMTGRIIFSLNGSYAGMTPAEAGTIDHYVRHVKESIHANLTYYYITDPIFLRRHANAITLYGILIGSIALAIISILIMLLSRRIYRPIESILEMFPRKKLSDTSASDIEFIRDGISGLCIEDARLRHHIQSARPYVWEQILNKILHDDISAQKAQTIMEEMSISFHREYTVVCILRISEYATMTRRLPEPVVSDVKEYVSADLIEALSGSADVYVVPEGNIFYAIINYDVDPDVFEGQLATRLTAVQQHAMEAYKIKMQIVIGTTPSVSVSHNVEVLMDALQESFISAEESMEYYFFTGGTQTLCRSSEHTQKAVNVYFFPPELEQEISGRLFMGQKQEAIELARDLIRKNIEANHCHYANIRQLLNDLLSVAIRTVLNSNTPLDRVLKSRQALHTECEECETLNQATEYICDVYGKVASFFLAADARWPIKREDVLQFIQGNLDKNFGITDIAEHFNLSKGYYCKIFREMTGITTLEYISRCRIERAQNLITAGRYPLKSIAHKVGISNYQTFIRLFKKYSLCTPGQYKQKIIG